MPSDRWKKQFRFHESTQRELCRMVFVCLALLPMIALVGYSAVRATPWYQSYQKNLWQQRISDNLGVDVRFTSIDFPSPDHFRAHNLVCVHPETGREILKVAHVHGAMDRRDGWSVELISPELNSQQLQSATQVIHDWFLCRPQKSSSVLHLIVPELLVYDGEVSTKFQSVDVGIIPAETTTTLMVQFSLEEQKFSDRAVLKVERNHALEAPESKWFLETKELSIPCQILAQQIPFLKYLGDKARFKGRLDWSQNDRDSIATLRGSNFSNIDFASMTSTIGTPLRGLGSLHISQGRIHNGTVLVAEGKLESTRDSKSLIDKQWLKDSITSLDLLSLDQSTNLAIGNIPGNVEAPFVELNFLNLNFSLNETGLLVLQPIIGKDQYPIASFEKCLVGGNRSNRTPLQDVHRWLLKQNPSMGMTSFLGKTLPWPISEPRRIASRPYN